MSRLRLLNYSTEELAKMQESGKAYLDLVVKGKWEREVDFGNVAHYYCSVCREEGKGTNFCPHCGADMREDEPDAPITREEVESGITTYVEGKYDPIYIGFNSHDCEAMYKCPKCGKLNGSWEWFGKKEFTCTCGAEWNVPK